MRPRLVACTPPTGPVPADGVDVWIAAGLDLGTLVLWLRDPEASPAEIPNGRLGPLLCRARRHGITTVLGCGPNAVTEAVATVRAHGLAGIHLRGDPGRAALLEARDRLGDGALLGRSCHRPASDHDLCDYGVFGPVFAPYTAKAVVPAPLGLDALALACAAPGAWLLALGGIDGRNATACMRAGAVGLAGIRSFFGEPARLAQDIAALCRALEAATRAPPAD